MKTIWKPSESLISILKSCEVDSDILSSAISSPQVISRSQSELALKQDFTRNVIEQSISWSRFTSRQKSLFLDQGTYLPKNWRPKESTIALILDELKLIGRVEIAEYRLSFLDIYQGHKLITWDMQFIKFVFDVGSQYREIAFENNQPSTDDYPLSQQIINKIEIRKIINNILNSTYVSPYFNKPLDDSWRPSAWVIKKLQNKFSIGRGFILNEVVIRRPFISFYSLQGKILDDYDILYFAWVSERQSKYRWLRGEEMK